jgi:hypothetical protein
MLNIDDMTSLDLSQSKPLIFEPEPGMPRAFKKVLSKPPPWDEVPEGFRIMLPETGRRDLLVSWKGQKVVGEYVRIGEQVYQKVWKAIYYIMPMEGPSKRFVLKCEDGVHRINVDSKHLVAIKMSDSKAKLPKSTSEFPMIVN